MNPLLFKCIKISFFFMLLFSNFKSKAQRRPTEEHRIKTEILDRRIFTGGSFGLQFGTITAIDISPVLGYRFAENIAAGVGLTYQYYRDGRFNPALKTDIYGGRAFARYYLFEKFFLHSEIEIINFEKIAFSPGTSLNQKERIWENNIFIGGGYRQLLGEFSSMHISILYNINQGPYSPFSNPQIRIGFDILL
jgi:hypothetical protein